MKPELDGVLVRGAYQMKILIRSDYALTGGSAVHLAGRRCPMTCPPLPAYTALVGLTEQDTQSQEVVLSLLDNFMEESLATEACLVSISSRSRLSYDFRSANTYSQNLTI